MASELNLHYKEQCGYHTFLVKQTMKEIERSLNSRIETLTRKNAALELELSQLRMTRHHPLVGAETTFETSIQCLQEGFSEMAL